jgi:plastocyanin
MERKVRTTLKVARWRRGCLACVATLMAGSALAAGGDLDVRVRDRAGRPVADVAITVMPRGGNPARAARPAAGAHAVLDQKNRAFVPALLVIGTGTSVDFPNNDTVSHQVYSFSPAKKFKLPLYKGVVHPPVTFDQPGLVVIGCNIHDEMVGYILVTDAPAFGRTDADGRLTLPHLAAGDYEVTAWGPYIADEASTLVRAVRVEASGTAPVAIDLRRDLRNQPEPRPGRSDWEY